MITVANEEKARQSVFEIKHQAYAENLDAWTIFIDAYDGQGGFLDGSYLDKYEREEDRSFEQRKKSARYHNYTEALVGLYTRKIFARPVERSTKNAELQKWLENVDGAGTDMSAFIQKALTTALSAGHTGVLCDKTRELATGPSKADERGKVFLTQYKPPSIQDWRTEADGKLAAVKLREAVGSTDLLTPHASGDAAVQMLLWDAENWVRVPHDKETAITTDEHNLGLVPFATLTPKPLERWTLVGKSLLGNANIIKAMFNRAAEEDQVLRDQAFSLLTVDVPTDGDIDKVKAEIGGDVGTTRAFVVHGTTKYISADMEVPKAIRENIAYCVQEIYRMAFMRSTRESLEAESAEAIKLKHDELNDFLKSIAQACAAFEKQLIRFWCGWTTATPEAGQQLFESLELSITYAESFFLGDLEQELRAWVQAIKMELGVTMEERVKMRAVHRLDPNLPADVKEKVEQEIKAIAARPKPDPMEMANHLRTAAAARLGQRPPVEGAPA